mgnify:CR=1 FL=1
MNWKTYKRLKSLNVLILKNKNTGIKNMKAETLLEFELIQIDKENKDFSELELLFKNYNKSYNC